jgi:hypothetical protein
MNHGQDAIKRLFDNVYNNNKHLLTPDIERYGKAGNYYYELSSGDGIQKEKIYGVTVLTIGGEKTDLNSFFSTLEKAERFIKSLR